MNLQLFFFKFNTRSFEVQILVLLLTIVHKLFGHSKLLFPHVLNKDNNISWQFNMN